MGRGARWLGTVLVALAACAGVGFGARALVTRARERAAAQAWVDLRACLVGPPLEPGETAAERLDRVAFALGPLPVGAAPEEEWPARCTRYAQRATDASSLRVLAPGVGGPAQIVAGQLEAWEPAAVAKGRAPARAPIPAAALEDLLAAGAHLDGLAAPAPGVTLPPLGPRPVISPREVEGSLATTSPYAIKDGTSLAGRPGAIAVSVGKESCVATPTSSAFACATAPLGPAFAWTDASGVWVEVHGRGRVVGANGSTLDELPLPKAKATYPIGPGALWLEDGRARASLVDGGRFGAARDLGPMDHLVDVRVCTRRRGAIVALRRVSQVPSGELPLRDETRATLWFADGAVWSGPVDVPPRTRLRESHAAGGLQSSGRWTLTCDDDEARLAWVEATLAYGAAHDEHVVHVVRCTRAACAEESAPVGALDVPRGFYGMNTTGDPDWLEVGVAIAAKERVVLAWQSQRGLFGRVAPLRALAAQASIPLVMARDLDRLSIVDDPSPREQDGAVLLLLEAERWGKPPSAVSTKAVLAIRAGATGFEPVRLR